MRHDLVWLGATRQELEQKVKRKASVAMPVSTLAATAAMALLWRSHRVLGGLLGFFIVGPVVGVAATAAASHKELKQLQALPKK